MPDASKIWATTSWPSPYATQTATNPPSGRAATAPCETPGTENATLTDVPVASKIWAAGSGEPLPSISNVRPVTTKPPPESADPAWLPLPPLMVNPAPTGAPDGSNTWPAPGVTTTKLPLVRPTTSGCWLDPLVTWNPEPTGAPPASKICPNEPRTSSRHATTKPPPASSATSGSRWVPPIVLTWNGVPTETKPVDDGSSNPVTPIVTVALSVPPLPSEIV